MHPHIIVTGTLYTDFEPFYLTTVLFCAIMLLFQLLPLLGPAQLRIAGASAYSISNKIPLTFKWKDLI